MPSPDRLRATRRPAAATSSTSCTARTVPDPYRWLEDAEADETTAWSDGPGRAAGRRADRRAGPRAPAGAGRRAARRRDRQRPAWRGDRQFFMRRTAEQEHAVLLTVDPDGTERVLVDPMALDPTGATTLDAWQPSKEGHLLAYQLSEGGTEESVLRVMDVATGDDGRRPDRPGPLLAGRLAARRRGVLLRPPARARPGARGRGAVPPPGLAAPARQPAGRGRAGLRRRAWTRRTTTASASRWTAAGWWSAPRPGRRRATTSGSPTCRAGAARSRPALRVVQEGVDASTSLHVGRDGRALRLHRPGRAPRPARRDDAGRPAARDVGRPGPRGPRGRARGLRDPRRRRARRPGAAVRLDPARDQRGHRPRPAHRRAHRHGAAARPGLGRRR